MGTDRGIPYSDSDPDIFPAGVRGLLLSSITVGSCQDRPAVSLVGRRSLRVPGPPLALVRHHFLKADFGSAYRVVFIQCRVNWVIALGSTFNKPSFKVLGVYRSGCGFYGVCPWRAGCGGIAVRYSDTDHAVRSGLPGCSPCRIRDIMPEHRRKGRNMQSNLLEDRVT